MSRLALRSRLRQGLGHRAKAESSAADERIYMASTAQLVWWRFRKHKLAVISGVIVLAMYLVALFAEFIAPYDPNIADAANALRPPSAIHLLDDSQSGLRLAPHVHGMTRERDPETLSLMFATDPTNTHPLRLLARGTPYKLWGLIPADIHLVGVAGQSEKLFLLGADSKGQDLFSRLVFGTRISMSVGLVGVVLSACLGILIGGVSGYYGGIVDVVIQRIIEFLRSIPTIPLWMALTAALPAHWSPLRVYLGITVILSLVGWTFMARLVRGRFLSMREEDFVVAARLDGCSELRTILYHMVPSFTSHIIAVVTLAVPEMILSETALSFLGLGLRHPVISWGVLLQEAQNVRSVALAPWLLLPGVAVVLAVLSFNFLGDGLRDAADPYGN